MSAQGQPPADPSTALEWLANGASGGDIRLNWPVAIVPRYPHTIIYQMLHYEQLGYYSGPWHTHNDGSFHSDFWEWGGCYGYPHDGTMESSGQATGAGQLGPTGDTHFYESAGLGSHDYIGDEQDPRQNFPVTYNVALWMARSCRIVGADIEHRVYPDLSQSTRYIRTLVPIADIDDDAGGSDIFAFGASEWTGNGNTNSETPYGWTRGFQWYDDFLDTAEILTQKALTSNAAVAAHSACVYVNLNPTHTDVQDKSGLGNHPSWDNSNRPGTINL